METEEGKKPLKDRIVEYRRARGLELLVWLAYANRHLLLLLPFAYFSGEHVGLRTALLGIGSELISGLPISLFPLAFYFIFGDPPVLFILRRLGSDHAGGSAPGSTTTGNIGNREPILARLEENLARSSRLADDTLRRSNTHLLLGLMMALAGVFLFFMLNSRSPIPPPNPMTWESVLVYSIALLPRFAILVFVEVTAGFFLKQYRLAMGDYRHFEELQRIRESELLSYSLRTERNGDLLDMARKVVDIHKGDESAAWREAQQDETENDHAQVVINLGKALLELGKARLYEEKSKKD